ncbi:MAG TPA: EamA family transporter [Actinomycetota bacterium]|jgi:drug/metabolite transporter (DMT)-like permease|nr:EamA family transporter [Actinomycetota bacterium]
MTRAATSSAHRVSLARVWAALGSVYVVWGTTYLAIRITNETLPPLMAAGLRFVIAGSVLYAFAVRRGDVTGDRPTRANWIAAGIVGAGLVAGGNGLVVLAEVTVPSGIMSLIIALVPLWMALIDRVLLRHRVGALTTLGLVLGFGGAAMLIGGTAVDEGAPVSGLVIGLVASLSWTSASLYSRNASLPARPLVGAGMQMLVGGAILVIAGALRGELALIRPDEFSLRSVLALSYLITVGSWVGYTSYVWLLRNARTSLVSTYAYVNPVVAVFLGWLILDEAITIRTVIAGAVVLVGVAVIISTGGTARREEPVQVVIPADEQEAVAEPA